MTKPAKCAFPSQIQSLRVASMPYLVTNRRIIERKNHSVRNDLEVKRSYGWGKYMLVVDTDVVPGHVDIRCPVFCAKCPGLRSGMVAALGFRTPDSKTLGMLQELLRIDQWLRE